MQFLIYISSFIRQSELAISIMVMTILTAVLMIFVLDFESQT